MPATASRCSARAVPQNTVVSFSTQLSCGQKFNLLAVQHHRGMPNSVTTGPCTNPISFEKWYSLPIAKQYFGHKPCCTSWLSEQALPVTEGKLGSKLLLSVQSLPGVLNLVQSLPCLLPTLP